jgi:hypothetical protein
MPVHVKSSRLGYEISSNNLVTGIDDRVRGGGHQNGIMLSSVMDDENRLLKEIKKSIEKMEKLRLSQEIGHYGLRWVGNIDSTMKERVTTRSNLSNSNRSKMTTLDSSGRSSIVEDGLNDHGTPIGSHLMSKREHQESRQLREIHKLNIYTESLNQQRISMSQKLDHLLLHVAQHPSKNTPVTLLKQKQPPNMIGHSRTSDLDEKVPLRHEENPIKPSRQSHSMELLSNPQTISAINIENPNTNDHQPERESHLDTFSKMAHIDENSHRNVDESDYSPNQSAHSAVAEFGSLGSPISRRYLKDLPRRRSLAKGAEHSETDLSRRLLTQIEYVESLEKAQARLLVLGNRTHVPLISSIREKRKPHPKPRGPGVAGISIRPESSSFPVDFERSSSNKPTATDKPSSPAVSSSTGTPRDLRLDSRSERVATFSRRPPLSSHPTRPPIDEYEEMKQRQFFRTSSTERLWQKASPNNSHARPVSSRFVSIESRRAPPISRESPSQPASETSIEESTHSKIPKISSSFVPERILPLENINVVTLSQLPDDLLLGAIKLKIKKMKVQQASEQAGKSITKFEKAQTQLEEQQTSHRDRLTSLGHPARPILSSFSNHDTPWLNDILSDTTYSSSSQSRIQLPSATTIFARGNDDPSCTVAIQSEPPQETRSFTSRSLSAMDMANSFESTHHIEFPPGSGGYHLRSRVHTSMFPHVDTNLNLSEDQIVPSRQPAKSSMRLSSSEKMNNSTLSLSPSLGTEPKKSRSQDHRSTSSDRHSTFKFDDGLDSRRMPIILSGSPDLIHKHTVS